MFQRPMAFGGAWYPADQPACAGQIQAFVEAAVELGSDNQVTTELFEQLAIDHSLFRLHPELFQRPRKAQPVNIIDRRSANFQRRAVV